MYMDDFFYKNYILIFNSPLWEKDVNSQVEKFHQSNSFKIWNFDT